MIMKKRNDPISPTILSCILVNDDVIDLVSLVKFVSHSVEIADPMNALIKCVFVEKEGYF